MNNDEPLKSVPQETKNPPPPLSGILLPSPGLTLRLPISEHKLLNTRNGTFVLMKDKGNDYAEPLRGKPVRTRICQDLLERGSTGRPHEVNEVIETLDAKASVDAVRVDIFNRVAPIQCSAKHAIEIDLGDSDHTRVRITPGQVEVLRSGSQTLFNRSSVSLPMTIPAETGDLSRLRMYVNLSDIEYKLLLAWISYTLAHPKVSTSKYVILVVTGDQGTGKSALVTNVILTLIDPTSLGLQIFPSQPKDLALAQQYVHVLAYDNMRAFSTTMSDILCISCTNGTLAMRMLYTNSEMCLQPVHGPIILNGILNLVEHSDLAQRCLPLRTLPLPESNRRSELDINRDFQRDLPVITRGLFDLIANIFEHLDQIQVLRPERMIDFTKWLAAMEVVDSVEPGTYQSAYSATLNQAQLDTLLEHPLADAVIAFMAARSGKAWGGSPSELLSGLSVMTPKSTQYSQDWPRSAISLSKRLTALKASFMTQGISIEMSRGKQRKITIRSLTDDFRQEVINDDDY